MLIEEILINDTNNLRLVSEFYCGAESESLSIYLQSKAFSDCIENSNKVYVVKDEKNNIVGYYSLKTSALQEKIKGKNNVIPLVELSEFAIDYRYQRKHYGKIIVENYIFEKLIRLKELVGFKGLIVYSKSFDSNKFYYSLGFNEIKSNNINLFFDDFSEGCIPMYISLKNILELKKVYNISN